MFILGGEVFEMNEKRDGSNLFFPLAAGLGVLFCVTVLAVSAAMFGDPAAPVAIALDAYGGAILAAEVGGILLAGFGAMTVDRLRTLRRIRGEGEVASGERSGE